MGQSKTSKFYKDNPESRKKRLAYQAEFNKRPSEVKKRVELISLNRKSHAAGKSSVGDGKDVSHVRGGTVLKSASSNRGSKTDSPGDRRARGGALTRKK